MVAHRPHGMMHHECIDAQTPIIRPGLSDNADLSRVQLTLTVAACSRCSEQTSTQTRTWDDSTSATFCVRKVPTTESITEPPHLHVRVVVIKAIGQAHKHKTTCMHEHPKL